MFVFHLKINKKIICRSFIIISFLIITFIIIYSIYTLFIKKPATCDSNELIDLNETNYSDFLKAANENIDSYVGTKVRVTGYVYRLIDFNKNQFVVARDMKLENNIQSVVIGFLCESKNAYKYSDGTWVEVIGKIKKGKFTGELAVLDVISIKETTKLEFGMVENWKREPSQIPLSF